LSIPNTRQDFIFVREVQQDQNIGFENYVTVKNSEVLKKNFCHNTETTRRFSVFWNLKTIIRQCCYRLGWKYKNF